MALKKAVANGNWSNPATWNGGVLPTAGDVAASNNFTVTIDQNINVDLLTNTGLTNPVITAQMTSNTTPSGVVNASSTYSSSYEPWRAFNQAAGEWVSNSPTGWLSYEFTTPRIVKVYQMFPPGFVAPNTAPRNWSFEGWDGSSWVVLDTVTGNSGIGTVTRTISNTIAYISYRINITLNNGAGNTGVQELRLYDTVDYTSSSVAGGGFILNSGVTATATTVQGNANGNAHCLRYDGSGSAALIGNVLNPFNSGIYRSLYVNTTGTFNWTGDLNVFSNSGTGSLATMEIANSGTTNWVGNHNGNHTREPRFYVLLSGTCTLNHTGNLTNTSTGGNNFCLVNVSAGCTYNLTGTANIAQRTNAGYAGIDNFGTTTIIGAVIYYSGLYGGVVNNGNNKLTIIGPITQIDNSGTNSAVVSTSSGAINLLSGPFIFSNYGYNPLRIVRMHLIPTITSYFEFRDETTNGAISPGAIAPATRMISPSAASDAPSASNVRFGTVYALGSQTGTVRIPHPNQVSYGAPVDNTFGAAVLSPQDVWNYARTNLTTPGSIGERLKNVSTVDSTGDQLTALL